jgi:hypothetical protein
MKASERQRRLEMAIRSLDYIRDELCAIRDALEHAESTTAESPTAATGYVVLVEDSHARVTYWNKKIWKRRDRDARPWSGIGAKEPPHVFETKREAKECIAAWHETTDLEKEPRDRFVIRTYVQQDWE